MRVTEFYQELNSSNQGIPIFFLSKDEWDLQRESMDFFERNLLTSTGFVGQLGQYTLIHGLEGELKAAYFGSGEGNLIAAIAQAAIKLPAGAVYKLNCECALHILLYWALAQYRFDSYKKNLSVPRILALPKEILPALNIEAETIFFIRDLINTPTNLMGPVELAKEAELLSSQYKAEFKQIVGEELLTNGFNAIHAVGRASDQEPRLIDFSWGDSTKPKLVLVGKGVCFDSGGLDIKPSQAMRLMKKDMGGAAHVLGLAKWIMANNLPVHLRVLIPAVENAISSNSYRPGDILTMRNDITVEVDNTDCEGRLILADALAEASEENPDLIINFATLTGAARIAVGTGIAAMFTPDNKLAEDLYFYSEKICDPIWRLPLFSGYNSMLESSIANLSNSTASPFAGAITAALFLQHFIKPNIPWVHFDIMAWNVSSEPGKPEGGEAMAVRAVAAYLNARYRTPFN